MMTWKDRYIAAHTRNFAEQYPQAYSSGHYTPPPFPDVRKANGLTRAIINFINWNGYNADRVNTQGRLIKGAQKQESGTVLMVNKYIKSANRKGTADIGATIKGKSVKIEIKTGRDKPSEEQLREQNRERRAGGVYEIVHTMDEVIIIYDSVVNSVLF